MAPREADGPTDRRDQGSRAERALYWQGELLEAMYWMSKEGIADRFRARSMAPFLTAVQADLEEAFLRLRSKGFVSEGPDGAFVFTPEGEAEAGRRFATEFRGAQALGAGHVECGPDCWCHSVRGREEPCPSAQGEQ